MLDSLAAYRASLAPREPEPGDFLFPDVNYTTLHARFARLAAEVRLQGVTLYWFRHSYASALVEQGENIKWIAGQLGHASPALTLKVYSHAIPGTGRAAVARLAAAMSAPRANAVLTGPAETGGNRREHHRSGTAQTLTRKD